EQIEEAVFGGDVLTALPQTGGDGRGRAGRRGDQDPDGAGGRGLQRRIEFRRPGGDRRCRRRGERDREDRCAKPHLPPRRGGIIASLAQAQDLILDVLERRRDVGRGRRVEVLPFELIRIEVRRPLVVR